MSALGPEWRRFSTERQANDEAQWTQHKFVWREAGRDAYRALIGTTLAPPLWEVRYAMFEGDVAARAEEWRVTIEPNGAVRQVRHVLPEARPGPRLSRDAALALAERHVREHFGADPAALTLVAADEKDRPARTDWSFMFSDPRVDVGKDGEARMVVTVSGDEITGAGRFVHVPESWLRAERERSGRMQIAKMAGALTFALAALAALIAGVRSWMRGHCDNRALQGRPRARICGVGRGHRRHVAVARDAVEDDRTHRVAGRCSPSRARSSRRVLRRSSSRWRRGWASGRHARRRTCRPPGGCRRGRSGSPARSSSPAPARWPAASSRRRLRFWPPSGFESAASPWIAAALDGLSTVSSIGVGLFVLHMLERVTAAWTRRSWVAGAAVVALITGLVALKAGAVGAALAEGIAAGLVATAVVYYVLRFDARTVPGYLVAAALIDAAETAVVTGTRDGWVEFALLAVVGIAVGIVATRYLGRPSPHDAGPAFAAAPRGVVIG